jgi:arylsulfatase A-like enzyme
MGSAEQTRRHFLASGAAATLARPARGSVARPNIVFLMPDQLRYHTVGCLGNADVRTPHIDRLAAEGLTLPNTFANTPVCCPARAVLLTGQYAHRNGMVANDLRLREDGVSFARELAGAGYRTAFVGKWHLDGGQRTPGFVPPGERRQGFEWWAGNQCSHQHFRNWYFRDTPEQIFLDTFETEGYSRVACDYLRTTREDRRPFYLTVQWGPPHDPYKAPDEYRRRYDADKLTMRPNWRDTGRGTTREDLAHYYGMTTAVDDGVGMVLKTLDDLGLAENTIVLFASDHGDMMGSQGLRLKRKPWEESIRVPGIVRWPARLKAGSRSEAFFSHVDFAPTLLGLAGVRTPRAMQGVNLAPVLLGGSRRAPDEAFFQIFGPYQGGGVEAGWRGVRTRRYMYARYREKPWVLYDLEKDPFELNNLAGDPAAAPLLNEMEGRLSRWMKQTGDSWEFNWSHPVEDRGRLYRHRLFRTVQEYLEWAKTHPELDAG